MKKIALFLLLLLILPAIPAKILFLQQAAWVPYTGARRDVNLGERQKFLKRNKKYKAAHAHERQPTCLRCNNRFETFKSLRKEARFT